MSTSGQPKSKGSVLAFILSLPFRITGWILISWISAVFIFSSLIILKGHAAGLEYCLHVLTFELKYYYKTNYLGWAWIQSLQNLSGHISITHFNKTSSFFGNTIKIIYPMILDYAQSVIAITEIVLIRLINLTQYIFLLLLLTITGLIHGLTQRYLRRLNGGRESALIYHYAKTSITAFIFWGCLLYVATPYYIEPQTLVLPSIIGSALGVFFTAKMFKKYS